MSTLPSFLEPASAPRQKPRRFPAPPPGSARWRYWKAHALCQGAAALRLFERRRRNATHGCSTPGGSTGVLTYHHVDRQVVSDPYLLNVTPRRFREQLEGLLRLGYEPCSLRDAVTCDRQGVPLAPKSFIVVFDDGLRSVYENAWPVLADLNIPATVFLATGYLDRDGPLPFDACHSGNARPGDGSRALSTAQCAEMLDGGLIDLGSHTHTHEDFCNRPRAFADDLNMSLQLLRERFGLESVTFSYPYGRVDAAMPSILARQELLCALTAECHCVTLGANSSEARYHWGRFGVTEFDTPYTLAAKLDGWYTWLQRHWRRLAARGGNGSK